MKVVAPQKVDAYITAQLLKKANTTVVPPNLVAWYQVPHEVIVEPAYIASSFKNEYIRNTKQHYVQLTGRLDEVLMLLHEFDHVVVAVCNKDVTQYKSNTQYGIEPAQLRDLFGQFDYREDVYILAMIHVYALPTRLLALLVQTVSMNELSEYPMLKLVVIHELCTRYLQFVHKLSSSNNKHVYELKNDKLLHVHSIAWEYYHWRPFKHDLTQQLREVSPTGSLNAVVHAIIAEHTEKFIEILIDASNISHEVETCIRPMILRPNTHKETTELIKPESYSLLWEALQYADSKHFTTSFIIAGAVIYMEIAELRDSLADLYGKHNEFITRILYSLYVARPDKSTTFLNFVLTDENKLAPPAVHLFIACVIKKLVGLLEHGADWEALVLKTNRYLRIRGLSMTNDRNEVQDIVAFYVSSELELDEFIEENVQSLKIQYAKKYDAEHEQYKPKLYMHVPNVVVHMAFTARGMNDAYIFVHSVLSKLIESKQLSEKYRMTTLDVHTLIERDVVDRRKLSALSTNVNEQYTEGDFTEQLLEVFGLYDFYLEYTESEYAMLLKAETRGAIVSKIDVWWLRPYTKVLRVEMEVVNELRAVFNNLKGAPRSHTYSDVNFVKSTPSLQLPAFELTPGETRYMGFNNGSSLCYMIAVFSALMLPTNAFTHYLDTHHAYVDNASYVVKQLDKISSVSKMLVSGQQIPASELSMFITQKGIEGASMFLNQLLDRIGYISPFSNENNTNRYTLEYRVCDLIRNSNNNKYTFSDSLERRLSRIFDGVTIKPQYAKSPHILAIEMTAMVDINMCILNYYTLCFPETIHFGDGVYHLQGVVLMKYFKNTVYNSEQASHYVAMTKINNTWTLMDSTPPTVYAFNYDDRLPFIERDIGLYPMRPYSNVGMTYNDLSIPDIYLPAMFIYHFVPHRV
jgi:hypothetical protein